jgi:hypothetical protein
MASPGSCTLMIEIPIIGPGICTLTRNFFTSFIHFFYLWKYPRW